jgi:ribosomal protein S27AE
VGLKDRLKRLEEAAGGGECPRCSGTVVIYVNDELESVTKAGRKFTPEEAEAFASEEEGGRCPRCGTKRGPEIRTGAPAPRHP